MKLDCVPQVELPFGLQIRGVRGFGGLMRSEMKPLAVKADLGSEFSFALNADAKQTASAIRLSFPQVLHVERSIGRAKVGPTVVTLDAVGVIDHISRPFASHIEPRKSVALVGATIDTNRPITLGMNAAGHSASGEASAAHCGDESSEDAGFRVVMKKLTKPFGRESRLNLAHAVVLLKRWCGKWSPTVSAAGLCAF